MKYKKALLSSLLSFSLFIPLLSQASIPNRLSTLFDSKNIIPNSIVIEAPDIAESGAVVSVKINEINSLPQGVYVTDIILFNEFRKEPVATFKIGPKVLPVGLVTRVKMKKSGNVYAIAKLSNGNLFSGEKLIKVTKGGCGGGA